MDHFKKLQEASDKEVDEKGNKSKKKKQVGIKEVLEGTQVYQERHYTRIERQLRSSYFVDYILSQMTLEAPESN